MNSRRNRLGIALLLLLSALTACKEKSASAPVLLRVDNRVVTLSEFQAQFAKTLPENQKLSAEERANLQRSFIVQLVDRQLALAEATRQGVTVPTAEVEAAVEDHRRDYPGSAFEEMLQARGITLADWRRDLEETLLIEKVARLKVYPGLSVSDEEIRNYFEENRAEFNRPAQVRARQIVVGSKEDGERILGLLRQGQSFADLAKQNSLSPDSADGGDLGFFSRGDMPAEFENTVFKLPVGKISDLVKSEYGYHLFLVEESRDAVRLNLEQAREEIRARLLAAREEAAYQQWLQNLRGQATIEIDWSLL